MQSRAHVVQSTDSLRCQLATVPIAARMQMRTSREAASKYAQPRVDVNHGLLLEGNGIFSFPELRISLGVQ